MLNKLILDYVTAIEKLQTQDGKTTYLLKKEDGKTISATVINTEENKIEGNLTIELNSIISTWNNFRNLRAISKNDLPELKEWPASIMLMLFEKLPFVIKSSKDDLDIIKLKEYMTNQLPEANFNQAEKHFMTVFRQNDTNEIGDLETNLSKSSKNKIRQSLRLLGFFDDNYKANRDLLTEYTSASNKINIIKRQLVQHEYSVMILDLLENVHSISKLEKKEALIELGTLIVRNSMGDNLMVEGVSRDRTVYLLNWLQSANLIDEELNPIMQERLRPLFIEVMENYIDAKRETFAGHELGRKVRNVLPAELISLPFIDETEYIVKGSVGQGNWATCPWVAIMNKAVTTTTQRGYYVVYLFSEDMERVYLTIAQGITETSRDEMERINQQIRGLISGDRVRRDQEISIGISSKGRGYEQSTAVYIPYTLANMPSEEVLITDLERMIRYYEECIKHKVGQVEEIEVRKPTEMSDHDLVTHIHSYINSKGFYYEREEVENLYLSLKTKPFVIISGISGTGKTMIVKWLAESVGATSENGQYTLIPVRPDWSDGSDLLGYVDIKGEFQEGPFTKVLRAAMDNPDKPYFICLDEMNLARVEYYFSDLLSVMESREWQDGKIITSTVLDPNVIGEAVRFPANVYVIGTVNMDETTHPFSKKVLDRANTIEFNRVKLDHFAFLENDREQIEAVHIGNNQFTSQFIHLKDAYEDYSDLIKKVTNELISVNKPLEQLGAHVGYRVRDEISFYMIYNEQAGLMSFEKALDFQIHQKILPRISGSDQRVFEVLKSLFAYCTGVQVTEDIIHDDHRMDEYIEASRFPKCAKKLAEMLRRYIDDGFTSFWIGA
ncbi:McrB family protein [Anaerobacillus sp. MEB173]|uniref:McrB family protein n=1 Tax=Anaerobacillus sp. MEB173 TaxID=3383345 RepID=UPI003F925C9A